MIAMSKQCLLTNALPRVSTFLGELSGFYVVASFWTNQTKLGNLTGRYRQQVRGQSLVPEPGRL